MKLSLKKKFYILILPSCLVLIALMVLLMVPHQNVQNTVEQINEGLAEVLPAEGFATHHERQLRECAGFIATGSPEHLAFYRQARKQAGIDIKSWLDAEERHTGYTRVEHAEELRTLGATAKAYAEVCTGCDQAIALASSGQQSQAMALMVTDARKASGSTVSENIDEQVPEEEVQLERYLDNLTGAVDSLSIMKMLDLESRVQSMRTHVASTVQVERFSRFYNMQIESMLVFLITRDPAAESGIGEARGQATEALKILGAQVDLLGTAAERAASNRLLERITSDYASVNAATDSAVALTRSGNSAGAISMIENVTGSATQDSLTLALDTEVNSQKKALNEDAHYISSVSTNTAWGVGILGSLLVVLALGGTFLVSRTVVGPVVKLRDAAREFGESGTGVDVEVKSHDELGELATTFNEMAGARVTAEDELRKARDELEERVIERTRELSHVNEELLAEIDERERTEEELSESERKYRELADSLPQVVFELDSTGKVVYVNAGAHELLGYDQTDVEAGINALEVIEPVDQDRVAGAIQKMIDGRSTGAIRQYLARRKDGTTFPCVVYSTLMTDEEGKPAGVRGILTDISERVEMERALIQSEERYRFLAENVNDFAFVVGLDLKTTYASLSVERILGYSPDDWIALPVDKQLTAESLEMLLARFADEMEHDKERDPERSITVEAGFNHRDGSTLILECVASFVRDADGNPVGIYGLARDITERRRAEQRLRLTQFEVDGSMDQVMRVASDGRIVYANDAACSAHGYTLEKMLRLGLPDISANFPREHWGEIWGVLRDSETLTFEALARREDATEFPLEASFNFIEFEGDEYMVIFGRDVTERKRAEEELKRTNAELEGYAHTVSHDLKGPLASTVLAASTLEELLIFRGKVPEGSDVAMLLKVIDNNVWKSTALIDDLLALAEAGQKPLSLEEVDVSAVVERILDENMGIINEREVLVEVEGTPGTVLGSPVHIYQLFANLIGDCLKHCDSDRPVVQVRFMGEGRDGARRYLIRDNGSGITPGDLDKVFVPFFKGLGGGTGIGLATAEKVVKLYRGHIRAYNDDGACFEFTINDYQA
jgi:PAS domain S-box-containing protein